MARDDFSETVKKNLALRVANVCSNPDCGAATSGPHEDPAKSVNLGVAAHITAASPGGPRFDPSLTLEQRSSAENGIWLCQNDGKLVDSDEGRFSVALLRNWKATAEREAAARLGKTLAPGPDESKSKAVESASKSFVEHYAEELNESFKSQPCEVHQMVARAVVTGYGRHADAFVECCCPEFARTLREALRRGGCRLAVRPTLLKHALPDSPTSPTFHLEDIRRGATISWSESVGLVAVDETIWYGTSLLSVAYHDTSGEKKNIFLARAHEKSVVVRVPGNFIYALRRLPGGPPALFRDMQALIGLLAMLRGEHLLMALIEAYMNEIVSRLRTPTDDKETACKPSLVWQVLGSLPEIETGLRELEQNTDSNAIKVAIVLDEDLDRDVFDAFALRIRGSSVKTWFRISDLMLASRFSPTLAEVQRQVDVLAGVSYPDQLELAGFGLDSNHPTWEACPEIPNAYTGDQTQLLANSSTPFSIST